MALMPKRLKEILQDSTLVQKALDNLSDFIGNKENASIQWDATKFVLTTLGKNKFSTRSEIVGAGGKDLIPQKSITKGREAVSKYFNEQK